VNDRTIDLKDLVKILKKRWRIIIGTFASVVLITAIFTFSISPTYEAYTTIRIKQPKSLANSMLEDLDFGKSYEGKEQMATYAEIIKTRTVVERVIQLTQADKEQLPSYSDMYKRITTQPVKDTELLYVRVKAPSPEEAIFVANTLINTFLERLQELVRTEQGAVREFIGERMVEAKQVLEKNEAALEQYKRDQKIVVPEEEAKAMVDRNATINTMVAENAVALASTQAHLSSVEQQLAGQSPGVIADSPLIQQYKGKLAELKVNLVSLKQNYTDKHPDIVATKAAIEETKASLSAEISRVLREEAPSASPIYLGLVQARLQNQVELAAASAQRNAINRVLADSEREMGQLPMKEQELVKLTREADVSKQIYLMLAQRYEEARISEVMQPTGVQIVDTAAASYVPVSPRKATNLLIGAILGLVLGTVFAFLLEYMKRTIRSAEDVQRYLDLPVLGSIPDYQKCNTTQQRGNIWKKMKVRLGL